MAIKEMQLHGVTSIKVQQTNSMQESFGVCTRRIRFETSDGTSLTVIAFAHDSDSLDLIHKPKALEGENQC
tara:strand:+ start:1458 stop:1670 length:213 start_codon:yes stop_codon:yes gene_type:complete